MVTETGLKGTDWLVGRSVPTRQVPSIGRIVAYTDPEVGPIPAMITEVEVPGHPESPVHLAVFASNALMFIGSVPYERAAEGTASEPNTWDWLPYVASVPA